MPRRKKKLGIVGPSQVRPRPAHLIYLILSARAVLCVSEFLPPKTRYMQKLLCITCLKKKSFLFFFNEHDAQSECLPRVRPHQQHACMDKARRTVEY